MNTFLFGPRGSHDTVTITAPSLRRAVRMFRVGTLFPHRYSDKRIPSQAPGREGYDETVYLSSEPGAVVEVWTTRPDPEANWTTEWYKAAEIPPETSGDEDAVSAARGLLEVNEAQPGLGALVPAGAISGFGALSRQGIEEKQLDLHRALGELEKLKRDLALQVNALKSELTRRLEQVWLIELFLGSQEEVTAIRRGEPAPASERVAVRQRVLCMDEEIAIHDWLSNPDRIGKFDADNLPDFDRWLVEKPEHLDAICPWAKGIVALRVRRRAKDRPELTGVHGAFARIALEEADEMVYVLVRNGENLHRLWVDVKLWPRFFAAESDVAPKVESSWDERNREARLKQFAAGLVMVAGILQRSDLLHPLPRPDLNPFDGRDVDAHFLLVRDDEGQRSLGDGRAHEHLTWPAYRAWLREQVTEGARVLWTGKPERAEKDALNYRTHRHDRSAPRSWPRNDEVFTLDRWEGGQGTFLYLPSDQVWKHDEEGYPDEVDRTRRIRFEAYADELLPVDAVSWRVLEHLLRDRSQREDYGDFFALAFHWWKASRAEAERERPFVDLVLSGAGVDLADEAERARAERLLRWWKRKVKVNRTLATDEAKALRMIGEAFRRGDDHDNDPEAALLRR